MAGALSLVEECHDKELAQMISLFGQAKHYYRTQNREVAIVLERQRRQIALAVDAIEAVEHFEEGSITEAPSTSAGAHETRFVTQTGRRKQCGSTVLILDTARVVGDLGKSN